MTNIHEIFNNTDLDINYPNSYIELFEQNIAQCEEKIAVIFNQKSFSYKELNEYGNKLANFLKKAGIKKDDRVGIYLDESIEMISTIVGILKSSASFIPMPDIFPEQRVNDIIDNAKIKVLLTKKKFISQESEQVKYVYLEDLNLDQFALTNLLIETNIDDCIYNIYTSGSTGKPKGVRLSNKNILNFAFYIINRYEITKDDNFSKFAGYGFDASILEIMPALLTGATLHILDKDTKKDLEKLNNYFEENKITISFLPTQFAEIFMEEADNKSLRCLFTGGEKLKRVKLRNYKICNIYGPTETTVAATFYEVNSEEIDNIPIGKPIDNYKIYIVDKEQKLCKLEEEGEIWIAGEGVGQGYIELPKLNAEKFIPNPFLSATDQAGKKYQTIYKSGDLGKWLPDGNIEYVGRIDFQVKIRGYRIELGEIEQKMVHFSGIKEAVALALKDSIGQDFICAYYTAEKNLVAEQAIKDYLRNSIPEYMIPQEFVRLEHFKINANGKIDRKALPYPHRENQFSEEILEAQTPQEKYLVKLTQEIFKRDKISLSSNFIQLGGNSLKALVLVAKLKSQYNITTNDILNSNNLKEISDKLSNNAENNILKKQLLEKYPATLSQKGIYFSWKLNKESTIYNTPISIKLSGILNINKLSLSINNILEEQRLLKSNFIIDKEDIFQIIKDHHKIDLKIEIGNKDTLEQCFKEFIRPFNLESELLFRIKIITLQETEHIIFIDIHHIINDGFSQNILVNEILQRYEDKPSTLSKYDYLDYAIFEKVINKTDTINFWQRKLAHFEKSSIPFDYPETDFSHSGATIKESIPNKLVKGINDFCRTENITEYCFYLGTFILLNYKIARKNVITVGGFFAGRSLEETQAMLGMFVATLPIVTEVKSNSTTREFFKELQLNLNSILDNQGISLAELTEISQLPIENSRNPFFTNAFNFVELFDYNSETIKIENLNFSLKDQCHFDLTAILYKIGNDYELNFEYNTSSYKEESIKTYLTSYLEIISSLLKVKEIKNIEFIKQEDKHKIINIFNATHKNFGIEQNFIEYFHRIVETFPNYKAVKFKNIELTYAELNARANTVALYLISKSVNYSDKVCLFFDESIEMIIGIIATLKASASFIPIADSFPIERVAEIYHDAKAKYILTTSTLFEKIFSSEKNSSQFIIIDQIDNTNYHNMNPVTKSKIDDCLYSIYTSGSTGKPKGVSISNLNVINLSLHFISEYQFSEHDCFSKLAGFSFDASILEIMPCLLAGGFLHVIPKEIKSNIIKLNEYFISYKISVAFLPTQLAEIFMKDVKNTSLKYLILGGDRLKNATLSNYRVLNAYGPTEATVACSIYEVTNDKLKNFPIGKPLTNYKIYILDEDNQLCPLGVAGELCIAGDGVALEYINLPLLNKEKFIANPFIAETDKNAKHYQRLYKSGDLARWLTDGNIEFLGREDSQVKIRGFRIELNEIEQRILEVTGIKDCIVIPIKMPNEHIYLCAYYVSNNSLEDQIINDYLKKFLPDYMMPEVYYFLPSFPVNQNGKIDRKKLPIPDHHSEDESLAVPETETEKLLLKEFATVLQTKNFGINSNFFRIGGNSLKAVQIVSHLAEYFNLEVSDIFKHKTIKEIAKNIKIKSNSHTISKTKLEKYPLTSAQKGVYLASIMHNNSTVYNIPLALEILGRLDKDKLGNAVDQLVENNRILRSYISLEDNDIYSKISKNNSLIKKDFQKSKLQEVEAIFQEFIKPFDLTNPPLFRIKLIQIENSHHILLIDIHHLINDGFSQALILTKIFNYYFNTNGNSSENKIDFLDFSQYSKTNIEEKNIALNKWKSTISKIEKSYLPFDFPEKQFIDIGDSYKVKMSNNNYEKVTKFCQNNSVTLYTLTLAAYFILVYKVTRKKSVTLGGFFSGRYLPELQNILGMFVSTLPIYVEIDSNHTNKEFLTELQNTISHIFQQQNCSIEELSQLSNLTVSDGRNKFFNNAFNFIDSLNSNFQDIKIKFIDFRRKVRAHFDLTLNCVKENKGIEFNFEFSTASYKKESIVKYAEMYLTILDELTQENKNIKNITFISNSEKQLILNKFNETQKAINYEKNYIEKFYRIADTNTNNTAIVFNDKELTYYNLNKYTNKLGAYLNHIGLTKCEKVIVYFNECIEMASSIITVLKLGASFIPIAGSVPKNRILDILTDANCKYILTLSNLSHNLTQLPKEISVVELDKLNLADYCENDLAVNILPNDPAYTIYTSGSTGKPKGVSISHKNILNVCEYFIRLLNLNSKDSFAKFAGYSFDASIIEILPTLISGASLHILDSSIKLDPYKLNDYFEKNKITNSFLPTQFSEIFMHEIDNQSLKNLITGGEKLKKASQRKYRFFNQYGPSETTIVASSFEYDGKEYHNIPIGKPVDNYKIYITDPDLNLCPIGVIGELCISGAGVGLGYIGLPELNQEKFISNPFAETEEHAVIYRTGDLAQWLPDGNIEYIGRIDFQVKIRGFRIELGEIEFQLAQFPHIQDSLVLALKDDKQQDYLCGYYVSQNKLDTASIRNYLAKHLPDYMIPEVFYWMSEFPINSNGKIDRKNFPKPERIIQVPYVAPRNNKEEIVAKAFSEVLEINNPSIYCNFFDSGGNSLKAIQLVTKIQKNYDIKISDIFKDKSIMTIAENLKEYAAGFNIDHRFKQIKQLLKTPKSSDLTESSKTQETTYLAKVTEYETWLPKPHQGIQNVLIFGSTGYLGSHILLTELTRTENNIFVIIRKNNNNYRDNFINILNYYNGKPLVNTQLCRIKIWDGDLTKIQFGLTDDDYQFLQNETDMVINCAANVKHYGEYKQFYLDNVESVINIIKFCSANIKLHHISTYSVAAIEKLQPKLDISEEMFTEYDFRDPELLENYYLKTKAEAEKLISSHKELKANIYRVGNLVFNTQTCLHQLNIEANAFYQKMKCLLNINTLCDHDAIDLTELSPVNNTAEAIVLLSQQDNLNHEVFHVYNDKLYKMSEIFSANNNCKYFEINNIDRFIDNLSFYYKHNYTKTILNNFLLHMGWLNISENNISITIKQNKTAEILKKLSFSWEKIYLEHFSDIIEKAYQKRKAELKELQSLKAISDCNLRNIIQYSKLKICDENEIIYPENTDEKALYLILNGFAQISIKSKIGGWISSIGILSAGDFIGIENLFENQDNNLIIDSIFDELILLKISENNFTNFKENKEIFESLFKYLLGSLNNKNLLISNFV